MYTLYIHFAVFEPKIVNITSTKCRNFNSFYYYAKIHKNDIFINLNLFKIAPEVIFDHFFKKCINEKKTHLQIKLNEKKMSTYNVNM